MITEDYVSFETAKLLKEKGFDEATYHDYATTGTIWFNGVLAQHNQQGGVACPTLQMAMKWLREVHKIAIDTEWEQLWYAYVNPMKPKLCEDDYHQCESFKYEEACEEAIKYCLENLI